MSAAPEQGAMILLSWRSAMAVKNGWKHCQRAELSGMIFWEMQPCASESPFAYSWSCFWRG
jgi:hypothetical protein